MVRSESTGRSLLVDRLSTRVEPARAKQLVDEAIVRAGRSEPLDDPDELLSFAKAHLIDDLVAAVGAREVSAFLDDLRESARLISGVRSREPNTARGVIALVDNDLFRRAGSARLLLARHLEVVVANHLEDLATTPLRPEVLILEQDEALSAGLFLLLANPKFRPAIVIRTRDPGAAMQILERAGVERYEIVATTTPADMVAAVERLLG